MAKQFIAYPAAWMKEVYTHFKNPADCARKCGINRNNLYKSFRKNGYISENMLIAISEKMNLSPLCFIDLKTHEHFYNDSYKMTFQEYKALLAAQKIRKKSGSKKNDQIISTLQLWGGLSDFEISTLPDTVLADLSIRIWKLIDQTLKDHLPGWY